jgi:excisionase family DNA binding protein
MVLAASPAQVGRMFSLPAHVVRNAARRNEFPAVRVGTRILIEVEAVREWLRSQPLAYPTNNGESHA